jgi:hypothetical protein
MRALALVLAAAGMLHAADRDFDRAVNAIGKYYGVKPSHIPLIGMANFFLKVARPAGTSGLQIANFDNLPDRGSDNPAELDHLISDIGHGDLHPLVVTHSRRDGESSYILAGELGKSSRLLIVTFEPREATVVEVNVNMDALLKMIAKPEPLPHDHLSGDGSR